MPYGEQRYNEQLHLLAWTQRDSRTKLFNKVLPHFYGSWNTYGTAVGKLALARFISV